VDTRPAVEPVAVGDDELAGLAMSADPDTVVGDDAVSFWDLVPPGDPPPLPGWYMPAPSAGGHLLRGWRRWLVFLIVAAFILINMSGLCSTYGWIELA